MPAALSSFFAVAMPVEPGRSLESELVSAFGDLESKKPPAAFLQSVCAVDPELRQLPALWAEYSSCSDQMEWLTSVVDQHHEPPPSYLLCNAPAWWLSSVKTKDWFPVPELFSHLRKAKVDWPSPSYELALLLPEFLANLLMLLAGTTQPSGHQLRYVSWLQVTVTKALKQGHGLLLMQTFGGWDEIHHLK